MFAMKKLKYGSVYKSASILSRPSKRVQVLFKVFERTKAIRDWELSSNDVCCFVKFSKIFYQPMCLCTDGNMSV